MVAIIRVARLDVKRAIVPGDGQDLLILANVELIVLGDVAVVLQRFLPVGLLVGRTERNVADLQQFRRCKEHHVGRIVKQ